MNRVGSPGVVTIESFAGVFSRQRRIRAEVLDSGCPLVARCSGVWGCGQKPPAFLQSFTCRFQLAFQSVFESCFETQPTDKRGNMTRSCECCHQLARLPPKAGPAPLRVLTAREVPAFVQSCLQAHRPWLGINVYI